MTANIPISESTDCDAHIAVVVPCYRVAAQIMQVLSSIGEEVSSIYVVDDNCPEHSGKLVAEKVRDHRVKVIYNAVNQGVGGAFMTGLKAALDDGAEIIVKIDGDGQMDPNLILDFIAPIQSGKVDFCKGNRFYNPAAARSMPGVRKFGNIVLAFFTKFSSGYWRIFDPTNGYIAIHRTAALEILKGAYEKRYFFESDLLFRLKMVDAVICDIPMAAVYGMETSSLKIHRVMGEFLVKNLRNLWQRVLYSYFLRDFNLASLQLLSGLLLIAFAVGFGGWHWWISETTGKAATAGTVMLSALPFLCGFILLMGFINYDVSQHPDLPLQSKLSHRHMKSQAPDHRAAS